MLTKQYEHHISLALRCGSYMDTLTASIIRNTAVFVFTFLCFAGWVVTALGGNFAVFTRCCTYKLYFYVVVLFRDESHSNSLLFAFTGLELVGYIPTMASFGYTESILLTFAEKLLGCGRTIYGDNYYSSVPLAEYLLYQTTYYCGTFNRKRRYCPKNMTHGQVEKWRIVTKENAKWVKTYNWKHKRSLLMLSFVPEQSDEFKATEKIQEIEENCQNLNLS